MLDLPVPFGPISTVIKPGSIVTLFNALKF
jgi:hypothetical protein